MSDSARTEAANLMESRQSASGDRDTIFALASAPGRAGVAVFRVSGPRADDALLALSNDGLPEPRRVVIRTLFDYTNDRLIDRAIIVRFISPHSYTGENIIEFQTHGGRAVVSAMLAALAAIPRLRLAEPGEFTRRAVEAGKLDLTQAEAIADLVNAETEAQRRQAFDQFEGHLGALYESWRGRLIGAAAWLEGAIDFPEDEVPQSALAQSRESIAVVRREIEAHLTDGRRGEILREGFHVAIIGPPNVGKSSLINALAQRDVAIVSETPGTTRDVIEVRLDLNGFPVILSDTAGLREAHDTVEAEGVRRAQARAKVADLRLLVLDSSVADPKAGLASGTLASADLVVWNKADLKRTGQGLSLSAKTGEGLSELIVELTKKAKTKLEISSGSAVLTRARHRQALEEAMAALARAEARFQTPELAAEETRLALRAIGRITGRVDLDELLDVVFRDFCVGK